MGAVFTNLKNSKTSDLNRLRPNLWGKTNLKMLPYQTKLYKSFKKYKRYKRIYFCNFYFIKV